MKKVLAVLSVFVFLFFAVKPSFASSNFSVSGDTTYTILPSGLTHTSLSFTVTNTSSAYYASSYKMHLGFDHLSSVSVVEEGETVTPKLIHDNRGYAIEIPFEKKIVGVGKTLHFTLVFDTPDIAENQGDVWEINIPGISDQNNFEGFNVHVKVPESFGTPSYIKPLYTEGSFTTLDFTKDELQKSGISIAYGDHQSYDFSLTYHLKNSNLFPITTDIALPPSTNYQDVYINSLNPQPKNVRIDSDGNWLASYYLLPGEKRDVRVEGNTELFLYPKKEELSEEDQKKYLNELPYWETSNDEIKKKAKELKTPSAIYQYVVKTLNYDFSRVANNQPRIGAQAVLANPKSAVCLEFSDLFVALSRAAGIPAREMEGYAHTKNTENQPLSLERDIMHAWPEYYDKQLKTWIMVDPTWGNTTGGVDYFSILDFDHFAFAIHGLNSQYPIAAGGYKTSDTQNQKDVSVTVGKTSPQASQHVDSSIHLGSTLTAGLPIEGSIVVKNTGNVLTDPETFQLSTQQLLPHMQDVQVPSIPPFGTVTVPIHLDRTGFLNTITDVVKAESPLTTTTQTVHISPFILFKLFMR